MAIVPSVLKVFVLSTLMMNGEALICHNCKSLYSNGTYALEHSTNCTEVKTCSDRSESCITVRYAFDMAMSQRDFVIVRDCGAEDASPSLCDEEKVTPEKWAPGFANWHCDSEFCDSDNCNKEVGVDEGWTDYDVWGPCDAECGGGSQARTRTCTNPAPEHGGAECVGNANETRACNEDPCPETIVQCDESGITLSLADIETTDKLKLREGGHGCEFTGDQAQEIKIGLHGCGTEVEYNNTHVIYKNQITATKDEGDSGIRRSHVMKVDFECAFARTGSTDEVSWEISGQTVVESIKGSGYLTFLLEIFKTDNFSNKIPSSDYPLEMQIEDMVYLQVLVNSTDPHMSLGVIHLEAKDTQEKDNGTSYRLIQDGCPVDSTLALITTEKGNNETINPKTKRFSFQTFRFLKDQPAVYVHAIVRVCSKDDNSCANLCQEDVSVRKRRSVDDHTEQKEYHLYQGPLVRSTGDEYGVSGVKDTFETKFCVLTGAMFLSLIL